MREQTVIPGEWRAVPRYEGLYEVSHRGLVRSLDRRVLHGRGDGLRLVRGKTLTPTPLPTGHLHVQLYRDGVGEHCLVHRLVLEAFAGPCPEGQECLHGRGGPADNRYPEAIHWGTHRENLGVDRHRDGTFTQAKLTPEIVLICRARRAGGDWYTTMGRDYGVSWNTVRDAVIGKTWKHVA